MREDKPWRLRVGKYARVFVPSPPFWKAASLLKRGYRPTHTHWWSKPNTHQRQLETGIMKEAMNG